MKKIISSMSTLLLIASLFVGCQKNQDAVTPQDAGDNIAKVDICGYYELTAGSVRLKAESNLSTKYEAGFCWSEVNPLPALTDSKTGELLISRVFEGQIRNLKPETSYYIRAYLMYQSKPIYSKVFSIKTLKKPVSPIRQEL